MTHDVPCFDRIVPRALRQDALSRAVAENPANMPASAQEAVIVTAKRWAPGRTLRIRFLDGERALHTRVATAAEEWARHAHIAFDFGGEAAAEVRISFAGNGRWSALGTDALCETYYPPGEPTMNLGALSLSTPDAELTRTVLHEFGHLLGLIHEHQSPAEGIRWDKEAVYREMAKPPNEWDRPTVQFNYFGTYDAEQTQYSSFDGASIMLYSVPAAWTLDRRSFPTNNRLSETDKAFIAGQYPRS